jgi:hypothetical protein
MKSRSLELSSLRSGLGLVLHERTREVLSYKDGSRDDRGKYASPENGKKVVGKKKKSTNPSLILLIYLSAGDSQAQISLGFVVMYLVWETEL